MTVSEPVAKKLSPLPFSRSRARASRTASKTMRRFLLTFIGIGLPLYGLVYLPPVRERVIAPFTALISRRSSLKEKH